MGPLPWQGGANVRQFGEQVQTAEALREMASNMIVIHEGKDDSEEYSKAFELMSKATRIYFLGFGYGATNLKRLGLERLNPPRLIAGTAMGLSTLSMQKIASVHGGRIRLNRGLDCLAFLKEMVLD
ncbi:MAG TPA: hypothetical protein PK760_13265 [Flavobacteriales bacterium]|nr:hypothetical protein [Flavobacteriales bacterium]